LHELEHQIARVARLAEHINAMMDELPEQQKAVLAALQTMRGIARLTAVTILTEVGDLTRFSHPTQLMSYAGLVPREHSSGGTIRRGAITKTGNAHLRRIIVESAWAYRHRPRLGYELKRRQQGASPHITELAWRAQERLNKRYRALLGAGKHHNKVLGAVARELLGFVWHVGVEAEKEFKAQRKAA
jgi:transposase